MRRATRSEETHSETSCSKCCTATTTDKGSNRNQISRPGEDGAFKTASDPKETSAGNHATEACHNYSSKAR
jgi:hypothetical protein